MSEVFAPLVEILAARDAITGDWLVDSQSIILAQQGYSFKARVAPE